MRPTITRRIAALTTAATLVLGAGTWVVIATINRPSDTPRPPSPVSMIDTEHRACFLTAADTDPQTATATWTSLTAAAKSWHGLLLQRFTVPTATKPTAYLTTLTQMRCNVIITIGDQLRNATAADAETNHTNTHLVVIDSHPVNAPGVTNLTPAQAKNPTTLNHALTGTP
ncbi:hypothetical protein [Streptacidiphilus cavernicola]|uniref:BMP family ABC transporter substrate-binding protein n=1 Tax=Streptacidiphilus cavernicola TaxID=3342716 RepID=A0ABV6W2I4_9ACTN